MRNLARTLVVLAAAVLATTRAEAGRIGGPLSDVGTIAPGETVWFDVPFAAGVPASVAVMGYGMGNVELRLYDGDGNVAVGGGAFERRIVTVNVYRAGRFRVELRNTGSVPSSVVLGTN